MMIGCVPCEIEWGGCTICRKNKVPVLVSYTWQKFCPIGLINGRGQAHHEKKHFPISHLKKILYI